MSADGGIAACRHCGCTLFDPFVAAGVTPAALGGEQTPALSVSDLISILRANPEAALQAVKEAKIAGPSFVAMGSG